MRLAAEAAAAVPIIAAIVHACDGGRLASGGGGGAYSIAASSFSFLGFDMKFGIDDITARQSAANGHRASLVVHRAAIAVRLLVAAVAGRQAPRR